MEDYSLTFEIDAEASKELLDKIKQDTEDQLNSIQQHFEERWQEARENHINVEGSPDDEFNAFIKDIFMFGCNVGWNDCYKFHEDLIQKGLNQQQINGKSKSSTPTID